MSVPEILNYIFDMLALLPQFTSDDQCQRDNPQQRAQKKTVKVLRSIVLLDAANNFYFEGTMYKYVQYLVSTAANI